MIWPSEGTENLVPNFTDVCATPTAPHVLFLLNESVYWASDLQGAAFGILHRDDQELATFRVVRVSDATKLGKGFSGEEVTTRVGDLTLAWGSAGDHVAVDWVDANDIVGVSAEGAEAAATAASLWLTATGQPGNVTPPARIPTTAGMPSALDLGPPVEDLPDGYSALVVNPLAFMGSDLADLVTIHRLKGIKALGAAIIVGETEGMVATVVAGLGDSQGLEQYAQEIEGSGSSGVIGQGFTVSDVDVLVVGYDREAVTTFTTAWEEEVAS